MNIRWPLNGGVRARDAAAVEKSEVETEACITLNRQTIPPPGRGRTLRWVVYRQIQCLGLLPAGSRVSGTFMRWALRSYSQM